MKKLLANKWFDIALALLPFVIAFFVWCSSLDARVSVNEASIQTNKENSKDRSDGLREDIREIREDVKEILRVMPRDDKP